MLKVFILCTILSFGLFLPSDYSIAETCPLVNRFLKIFQMDLQEIKSWIYCLVPLKIKYVFPCLSCRTLLFLTGSVFPLQVQAAMIQSSIPYSMPKIKIPENALSDLQAMGLWLFCFMLYTSFLFCGCFPFTVSLYQNIKGLSIQNGGFVVVILHKHEVYILCTLPQLQVSQPKLTVPAHAHHPGQVAKTNQKSRIFLFPT